MRVLYCDSSLAGAHGLMMRACTVPYLVCRRSRTGKGRPRNGRTSAGCGEQRARPSIGEGARGKQIDLDLSLFFFTNVPDEHVQQMDLSLKLVEMIKRQ